MSAFINGIGTISAQQGFGVKKFAEREEPQEGDARKIIAPDYKEFIEPRMLRRMSKILKMGVSAGIQALRDAGIESPDAICTATALGCTQDTDRFLRSMVELNEQTLSPTSFIQSTHNTIGGQIALHLGLKNYNMTYTQRGHSFESALLDSMMMLEEGTANNVLLGGVDELIEPVHTLMHRLGVYQKDSGGGESEISSRGVVGGEGASFFVLGAENKNAYAEVKDLQTLYRPDFKSLEQGCHDFLNRNGLTAGEVDLYLSGESGEPDGDHWYRDLKEQYFSESIHGFFKPLCGEHQSAIGFAVWMAALALRKGSFPSYAAHGEQSGRSIKNVLIYNHFQQRNHTFLLLSAC